jgi:GMP synthase (glutamine-hydrolysing)
MKKPILILQFRTDKSLAHERSQIIKHGKFKKSDLNFVNVMDGRSKIPGPSDLKKYRALIIAGSGQYNISNLSADVEKKMKRAIPLIKAAVKNDFPTLGICFGHQLISHLFGGRVVNDDKQAENGTYEIKLNSLGTNSKLYKNIPQKFYVVLGHKDSVVKLPKDAKLLATGKRCKIQSYQLKKNIYCLQSHPELEREGLMYRLQMYPEYLKDKSLDEVKKSYNPVKYAPIIIENFNNIVEEINA